MKQNNKNADFLCYLGTIGATLLGNTLNGLTEKNVN